MDNFVPQTDTHTAYQGVKLAYVNKREQAEARPSRVTQPTLWIMTAFIADSEK
jgi:hypothetical protein